ncbi:MAG TPA: YopX family protein [Bacteroidia bacterium]|nr:YopX family protein [Bacteroidia bacterium]
MNEVKIPQFKIYNISEKIDKDLIYINSNDEVVYISTNSNHKILYAQPLYDVVICRFTGYFSKQNIPLYADDIVEDAKGRIMHITRTRPNYIGFKPIYETNFDFTNKMWEWGINSKTNKIDFKSLILDVEIIGSKFETPELLEATNE